MSSCATSITAPLPISAPMKSKFLKTASGRRSMRFAMCKARNSCRRNKSWRRATFQFLPLERRENLTLRFATQFRFGGFSQIAPLNLEFAHQAVLEFLKSGALPNTYVTIYRLDRSLKVIQPYTADKRR